MPGGFGRDRNKETVLRNRGGTDGTMKFYMPVSVFDEINCVKNHAKELASCGTKALIVTGRSSAVKCGALADVRRALEENGCACSVFSDVEENPSVETVVLAAEYGLSQKADFVIGIGGGSPMDAAKAIAFLMKQENPSASYLYDAGVPTDYLPVIAVPTTCGTGSEVTGVSVLTNHARKTKGSIPHRIYPSYAFIDGRYLYQAPHSVIVNTSVDALAHLMESYLSSNADDYSRYAALSGLDLWSRIRCVLTGDVQPDAEDFARLMRSSTLAGIAIAQTGTSLPHALSYIVTYDTGLAHGPACGLFLPGFAAEASPEDQEKMLRAAGFWDVEGLTEFLDKVLQKPAIPGETLARTFEAVTSAPAKMKSCIFHADEETVRRIIAKAGYDLPC